MLNNDFLKTIREEKGDSPELVAITLGVLFQTYADWESGRVIPDEDEVYRLSEYFCCPIIDFYQNK